MLPFGKFAQLGHDYAILGPMSETSLRERKKVATRLAISRAALKLALASGANSLTGDAIAEAANVAPRTFRNYFSSKEDALLYVLDDFERRVVESLRQCDSAVPVLDAFEAAVIAVVESSGEELEDCLAVTRIVVQHPTLRAHFVANNAYPAAAMLDEIARRSGTDPAVDIYPRIVCFCGLAVLRAALEMHSDAGLPRSEVPDAIRRGFTELRSGLAQPARRN
jgi:AcrR family transcriptional regulator